MFEKMKFYSLDKIKKENATYNMIIGERSNGKSYAVLYEIIKNYFQNGKKSAIIRRYQEDFKNKRGSSVFNPLVVNNVISELSHNEWSGVYFYSGRWYLTKEDENHKIIKSEDPFCYSFALTDTEHDKSSSYPDVTLILFDEFMSRTGYLPDEFILFMNTLSTIIRYRDDVVIYMLGNTVNRYCPYFDEMGLTNIRSQQIGTIDVYTYGNSNLKVAVEYSDSPVKKKPSDKYFAFSNSRLSMITNSAWEIAIYPHCPVKYCPKDIKFTYFIKFQEDLLQCEIIMKDNYNFTFIHKKTTDLKHPDTDIIFDTEYKPMFNYGRKITVISNNIQKKIAYYFINDKVFYQDNLTGEIVRNYIMWCKTDKIT